jgi:hypothetical protein
MTHWLNLHLRHELWRLMFWLRCHLLKLNHWLNYRWNWLLKLLLWQCFEHHKWLLKWFLRALCFTLSILSDLKRSLIWLSILIRWHIRHKRIIWLKRKIFHKIFHFWHHCIYWWQREFDRNFWVKRLWETWINDKIFLEYLRSFLRNLNT